MPGYNVSDSQLKGAAEGVSKYRCPGCRLLLRDAVQPSCGHWLCQTCAELLFRKGLAFYCMYRCIYSCIACVTELIIIDITVNSNWVMN